MKRLSKEFGDVDDGTAPATNGKATKATAGTKRKRGKKDTADDESPAKQVNTGEATSEENESIVKDEAENGDAEDKGANEDAV